MPFIFTESDTHVDFARFAPELAQVLAAHRDGDRLRDLAGGQADGRRTVAIDDDPDLLVTALGIGTHVLEAFDRLERSRDIRAEFIEDRGRVARYLEAEALASALLVELEVRLADRQRRHVLLDALDDLRGRQGRVFLVGQQQRGFRALEVVVAVNRANVELFLP